MIKSRPFSKSNHNFKAMKKSISLLITFVSLFLYTNAQWTQGLGMSGGDFRCLTKIGTDIYAGSQYGGVFRSSNNGDSWTPLLKGLPGGVSVTKIMNKGTTLFAGTSYWSTTGQGVFRSDDNGATWVQKNNGILVKSTPYFTDLNITGLAKNSSYIFASTQANGIYKSDDNGDNWVRIFDQYTTDSSYREINAICCIGEVLIAGGMYGDGMYKSIDNGATWNTIITGLPSGFIVYGLTTNGTNVYANTSHGFYWSPSNGDYWIGINYGITDPYGAASGAICGLGNVVYASTNGGSEGPRTYKSINGGSTFVEIPAMEIYRVSALLADGNNVFAGNLGGINSNTLTIGGVVRSIDNGASWSPANIGLSGLSCTSITSDGTNLYAGSRYYSGIYQSGDNGGTWTKSLLPGTNPNYQILSMLSLGSVIYAGNNTYTTSGGVFNSNDYGLTWNATAAIGKPVYAMGANTTYIYAGTNNDGMRRSTNGGTTWTTVNTGLPTIGEKSIRAMSVNGSKIHIGTARGVFISTNDGTNWTAANGGTSSPGYCLVKSLAVKGDTILGGGTYGIIRSTNNGVSWSLIPLTGGLINALLIDGTTIYAGGRDGVSISTDWGVTWTSINSTFPLIPEVYSLLITNGKLYAGTYGQSVWSIDLSAIPAPPRILNLSSVLLEGLYNGAGVMRQASDESGPHFTAPTADQVTVELHNASHYSTIEYTASNVKISTTGTTSVSIPSAFNGSYYIAIKHRNSIQTVSAAPVSFSGNTIAHSFANPVSVFGGNLLLMADGYYALYGGDVNLDGIVDGGDMSNVDNSAAAFSAGYIPDDCNGDGLVDGTDMSVTDNNAAAFVGEVTP